MSGGGVPGTEYRVPNEALPSDESMALYEVQRARRLVTEAMAVTAPNGNARHGLGRALAALQNAEMFLTGDPG